MTDQTKPSATSTATLTEELDQLLQARLTTEKKLKSTAWFVFIAAGGFGAILAIHVFLLPDAEYGAYILIWMLALTGGLYTIIDVLLKNGASSRQEIETLRRIASDKEST